MKNKDVGMGLDDFLSLGGHLLVPFLYREVTSLHPLHFREMIFPLVLYSYLQHGEGKGPPLVYMCLFL